MWRECGGNKKGGIRVIVCAAKHSAWNIVPKNHLFSMYLYVTKIIN